MSSLDSPSPEELAFDRAFTAKLAEFAVPADLEAKLLALGKQASPAQEEEPQLAEIIRPNVFKRHWVMAAAAAVAVVIGVGALIVPAPVTFPAVAAANTSSETFRDHMALFANARFWLDDLSKKPTAAQASLQASGTPVFASVPERLAAMDTMGCKSIDWNGSKVGLVCFTREDGEIVHLFTADKDSLNGTELANLTKVETIRGLKTAGWSDDEHVYMLVGSKPGVEVADYLPAEAKVA